MTVFFGLLYIDNLSTRFLFISVRLHQYSSGRPWRIPTMVCATCTDISADFPKSIGFVWYIHVFYGIPVKSAEFASQFGDPAHTRFIHFSYAPPPVFGHYDELLGSLHKGKRSHSCPKSGERARGREGRRRRCDKKTPASPERVRKHGRNAHFIPMYEKSMITLQTNAAVFSVFGIRGS